MSRRRRKRSIFEYLRMPSMPDFDLDAETKKGIYILVIAVIGAISFLGLIDKAGLLGGYIESGLKFLFGWGRWTIPFFLVFWAVALYDEERFSLRASNYFGVFAFLVSINSLFFLLIERGQWESALALGRGGGYIGYQAADFFITIMGYIAALFLSFGIFLISLLLIFNTTLSRLIGRDSVFARLAMPINFIADKIIGVFKKDDGAESGNEDAGEEGGEEEDHGEDQDEENNEDEEEKEDDDEEDGGDDEDGGEDEEESDDDEAEAEAVRPAKPQPKEEEKVWWMKPERTAIEIPLSLLNGKRGKPTSGDIDESKKVIKKSLENFGIPVEMATVSVGPTVTQYTFRPAEGVKLSRITNLSNDLALALAAHPIRIEAPIPGKALVGVEVPNQTKAVVCLKEILVSKNYSERKNNQQIALGKDVAGASWVADITKMPHLLVAGATNSGKSVCLNTIIVSLMYQNSPDDLKFIMVDPKRVELVGYNGISYLLAPVITEVPKTINALKWCLNEMDRRFDILSQSGQRNIQSYNESNRIKMPYLVFIIDELADLMVAASKDIEGSIIRLAQMARAVGIHLVLATQRPSVDVITGLIKANMPARIAFSVASSTDSRTILDCLGAEKLLGRGDMLFVNAELSKPVRLQGAYLSDEEIKRIVKYVKAKGGRPEYLGGITERQKVSGIGGIGLDGVSGDEDELLAEARETVVNMGKASASLLQRKMRIGYARAASILDQLEEAGVVGPANGAKPREILITKRQLESLEDEKISAVSVHNRSEAKAPDSYLGEESEVPPVFREPDGEADDSEDEDDGEDIGDDDGENDFGEDEENGDETEESEDDQEKEDGEDRSEEKSQKNNQPFDRLFAK